MSPGLLTRTCVGKETIRSAGGVKEPGEMLFSVGYARDIISDPMSDNVIRKYTYLKVPRIPWGRRTILLFGSLIKKETLRRIQYTFITSLPDDTGTYIPADTGPLWCYQNVSTKWYRSPWCRQTRNTGNICFGALNPVIQLYIEKERTNHVSVFCSTK